MVFNVALFLMAHFMSDPKGNGFTYLDNIMIFVYFFNQNSAFSVFYRMRLALEFRFVKSGLGVPRIFGMYVNRLHENVSFQIFEVSKASD